MTRSEVIPVEVAGAPYSVHIGAGILEDVGAILRSASSAKKIALVSDSNVAELFGLNVASRLVTGGFDVFPLTVAPGESSKSWQVAGELVEAFAEIGLDRADMVVALGGGVIGDLAGFTAATYLRGIEFAQIPTTLLAQVDSSVGGKTGVDLRAGKNLAGAFKQPVAVVADVKTLQSLSPAEWASGMAEVAKSAVIDSDEFTAWLELNDEALCNRSENVVIEAVRRCLTFKSRVVSADEREEGVRECLNYGHTLGHAIENVAGYGVVPHGVAVAEGMRFASRLAVEVASGTKGFVRRQDALLDRLGLPTLSEPYAPEKILAAMHADKKARAGSVRFVLADAPGVWRCEPVGDVTIGEHLVSWAASKKGV